jgi:hypothetical protein
MAGRPKKIEETEIVDEAVVETSSVDEKALLKQIEDLKKQLAQKESNKIEKIPNDTEIEIEVGINSSVYFYDERGRINYMAKLDGMGATDVIDFSDLKKMMSTVGKKDFLTKGFFIIKGDVDDEISFEQIIKELRLKDYYSGKLHYGNAEEVMIKGKAKDFIDGIDEISNSKSEMLTTMIERFKYLYDKGRIKDVDKINKIKYIVSKSNPNIDLFK